MQHYYFNIFFNCKPETENWKLKFDPLTLTLSPRGERGKSGISRRYP
jgi:hypothetical protein